MREITPEARARIILSAGEPADGIIGDRVRELGPVAALEHPDGADRYPITHGAAVADQAIDTMLRLGIEMLTPEQDDWPAWADDLRIPPLALYVIGNVKAVTEERRRVSIVGARAATSYGEHVARELAADLAHDHVVISGGAYGIDGTAHRAAVSAGESTVAFLAGGVDRPYPAGNANLLQTLSSPAGGGALVSEGLPGSAPTRWRFLARNRLIAAAGNATVVVEAGFRSGSLSCANDARALGRPLGAVPGPITSVASAGTNQLLRNGARPITSADDVRALIQGE